MNQPFTIRHKEEVVGAFVLVAAAIFIALLALTMMRQELFKDTYILKTEFASGAGLNPGASVSIAGMNIGTISQVELNADHKVTVYLKINKTEQKKIRKNAMATIQRVNPAVGDKIINIQPGTAEFPMLEDSSTIKSEDPAELDAALSNLVLMVEDVKKIITGIEQGEGTVGGLLKDKSTLNSANELIRNGGGMLQQGNQLIRELQGVSGQAQEILNGVPQIMDGVSGVLDEIDQLTQRTDSLMLQVSTTLESVEPLITGGKDQMENASDIMHSVKSNWLIRRKLPKEIKDELIYDETRY